MGRPRDERRRKSRAISSSSEAPATPEKSVGVNRVIRVVSTGDLTFSIDEASAADNNSATMIFPVRDFTNSSSSNPANVICMTTSGFTLTLLLLLAVLVASCGVSAYLCVKLRPFRKAHDAEVVAVGGFAVQPVFRIGKNANEPANACFYS